MTAAVLVSQNRAISIARDATTARVLALELLAAQVAAAEAARRDWETSHRMAANNDRYLDLLARTAANQRATAEITGLAEQAAEAAQAFRETLQRATLAAEALALPESR
jgi:N-methylhydantoinase B/oxoprolinase/acetone carboxylase alpha subunit